MMDQDQQEFEDQELNAAEFILSNYTSVNVGDYCMLKGIPCLIKYKYIGDKEITLQGNGMFNLKKYKVRVSPDQTAYLPIVTYQEYQVYKIEKEEVSLVVGQKQEGKLPKLLQSISLNPNDKDIYEGLMSTWLEVRSIKQSHEEWMCYTDDPLTSEIQEEKTAAFFTVQRALGWEKLFSARMVVDDRFSS